MLPPPAKWAFGLGRNASPLHRHSERAASAEESRSLVAALTRDDAFSLVELSIVLVILGLLTGGILTGQNLIRAAELRSVTTEVSAYHTAVMTFRDKYFALPGDMPNATKFWGSKGGNGADDTCYAVEATGTPTCSGDGNGYDWSATSVAIPSIYAERLLTWQHMANAGLISGQYTGRTDSATSSFLLTRGKNAPASKVSSAFWDMTFYSGSSPGDANVFAFSGIYMLILRHDDGVNQAKAPLLAEEVWSIDTKIDDGKPGRGRVHTHKKDSTAAPNCATTNDPATAEYNLTNTANKCHVRFLH